MKTRTAIAVVLALAAALPAAAIPDVVTWAARVENNAGPFDGTASVTFELFGERTDGTALWTEAAPSVVVVDGDLIHDLGSVEPLDDALLDRDALFLEVTFNGTTLTPRVAVNAAPFALRAREAAIAEVAVDAEQLGGRAAATYQFTAAAGGGLALSGTSFFIATGGINSTHLADGAIASADLANSAVTSAILADLAVLTTKLADGAVSLVKLGANSVDGTKIIDGSIGNAELGLAAVNATKLAASAVTSAAILDGGVATADLGTAAVTEAKIAAGAVTRAKLSSGIPVFELEGECGTGLTTATSCRTKMCDVRVTRDSFNTILDVVPLFSDCANRCSATSAQTCAVSATAVGVMVGP